jgi:hypothetical protein
VRLEGNCHRARSPLLRADNDFSQYPNMRPVHPIEISHADQRWPEVRWNFFEFAKNLH